MKIIKHTHEGRTGTLTEWAAWTGVPKPTIDRRLRAGKSFAEAIAPGRAESKEYERKAPGRTGLTQQKADAVRQDYKDGIRGKANYEKHKISKDTYIDIILNRTWRVNEPTAWWKGPPSLP